MTIAPFGSILANMPFDTCSAVEAGKASGETRRQNPLRQLVEMQGKLHSDVLADDTAPSHRAACARAWKDLEEQKRILKGQPLPGSLKPEQKHKRKPSPIAPSEPLAVVPVAVAPAQPSTAPSGAPICHSPIVAPSDEVSQSDALNQEPKP